MQISTYLITSNIKKLVFYPIQPHSPLKDKLTEKGKFSHHLLTSIPMESHVKFCSAQKILRALPQNNIGPCSYTAEVDVDLF